jgi:hypothetical protein
MASTRLSEAGGEAAGRDRPPSLRRDPDQRLALRPHRRSAFVTPGDREMDADRAICAMGGRGTPVVAILCDGTRSR